jgi:hypothetical protein
MKVMTMTKVLCISATLTALLLAVLGALGVAPTFAMRAVPGPVTAAYVVT